MATAQSSLSDTPRADVELDGACLVGHDNCGGVADLFFGRFPCGTCWLHAPASAHYYHSLWEGQTDV